MVLLEFSRLQRSRVGGLLWTTMKAVLGFNNSVHREGYIVGRIKLQWD